MYVVQSIHIWERVRDEKKQEGQKCPAGTRQTDSKNWGLVWRNRKKISQIIKDYFHLPFFLLIILCSCLSSFYCTVLYQRCQGICFLSSLSLFPQPPKQCFASTCHFSHYSIAGAGLPIHMIGKVSWDPKRRLAWAS